MSKTTKTATATLPEASEVLKQIADNACKSSPELRFVDKIEVGEHVRQGDIAILCIGNGKLTEALKKEKKARLGAETDNHQLAPGTNKGSRHILAPTKAKSLTVFTPAQGRPEIEGPIFETTERVTITHPEHGHISIPAGTYQVDYQVDHRSEEAKQRRVQD